MSSEPVTVVFVRNVRPERIQDFEEWVKGITKAVREFEGYQGADIIRPSDHSHPEYVIVLRFDEYAHLRAWMGSVEREMWVKKSEEMTIGETYIQEAHGFEPWFTLPDHFAATAPPAKSKMALLTILAIYPPLLAVSTILALLMQGWPRFAIILLTVILLVPAMTYYIMPWMTRLFRPWLYPNAAAS
ncbi:MAG: antibiotic biosynthesis monooxygenase [Anaerolineales bacterium]